jgi:hypothetical protein
MYYGARCRPGDTSELAVGKEWKEEDEELLGAPERQRLADTFTEKKKECAETLAHTVKACHTIWRFINS